jgi:hypothetical protein
MGAGTFFYAHGAGNREADAAAYAVQLREGLGLTAAPNRLRYSKWGAKCGPDPAFPLIDETLPLPPAPGPIGLESTDVEPAAADSFAPLKALASPVALEAAAVVPKPTDIDWLVGALKAGTIDLSDIGISQASLTAAAVEVEASPEFAAAGGDDADLFDAVLTSIVARARELEPASGPALESFSLSDISDGIKQAVGTAANRLLGSVSSAIGGWIGPKLKPAALLAISRRAATQRSAIMHSSGFLVPADVLFYQRRGADIRAFIRTELAGLPRPVVAMGHSLGGIALVDTLFGPDAPAAPADLGVDQLITFGSQSAMLKAIGAIDSVKPRIPWLNIWTLYDFVSFRAADILPGAEDKEIAIEVGFPDSHGAYYTTPAFFDAIKANPIAKKILS